MKKQKLNTFMQLFQNHCISFINAGYYFKYNMIQNKFKINQQKNLKQDFKQLIAPKLIDYGQKKTYFQKLKKILIEKNDKQQLQKSQNVSQNAFNLKNNPDKQLINKQRRIKQATACSL
ncbi:hypothetical protein TTHERM_000196349 (macronuclear) [Tetrahymena thermophila SB210]|uniref:Uncharacterized protein n=1 Tax=Tetrahymena thermophila (strain SB210) TaxID=312017 RepID=W7XJF5_TETTS|nr:hypothetical protein TTHERM_000196349 [Tetrahymena thermophila SB210]EWS74114.1 hypothetical protein TTHERM_000196349 [Tetrahymena thermophila SB210]|eukprot:XP_012653369.1 hypothetical protein TTHERM_000196349 [Tetrahymena thermophila SB210]